MMSHTDSRIAFAAIAFATLFAASAHAQWSSDPANNLVIADRTNDYLGASDVAVSQFRRQMLAAAKQVASGGTALGATEPRTPHLTLSSFEGIVPKSTDWRSLGKAGIERAAPQKAGVPAK